MILIKSNSTSCDVQGQIFVLRVLFGLVVMQPSRVGDGVAQSVLVVPHQGVTADRQGATVVHQGAAVIPPSATIDHPGALVDR
jgi:hypothetical protein